MNQPGPDISGSILGLRNLKTTEPELLQQADGLRPERFMCEKVGQPNFRCQTQMEYPTAEEAAKLKLPPGTGMVLHKCVRPGSMDGAFVPVRDVQHALEVAQGFCACVENNGKVPKAKAVKPEPPKFVRDAAREKCARKKD